MLYVEITEFFLSDDFFEILKENGNIFQKFRLFAGSVVIEEDPDKYN